MGFLLYDVSTSRVRLKKQKELHALQPGGGLALRDTALSSPNATNNTLTQYVRSLELRLPPFQAQTSSVENSGGEARGVVKNKGAPGTEVTIGAWNLEQRRTSPSKGPLHVCDTRRTKLIGSSNPTALRAPAGVNRRRVQWMVPCLRSVNPPRSFHQ